MAVDVSPDGKEIAFTSDRSGGDNIWVMDRDGRHVLDARFEVARRLGRRQDPPRRRGHPRGRHDPLSM